jgi:hypothetical protein
VAWRLGESILVMMRFCRENLTVPQQFTLTITADVTHTRLTVRELCAKWQSSESIVVYSLFVHDLGREGWNGGEPAKLYRQRVVQENRIVLCLQSIVVFPSCGPAERTSKPRYALFPQLSA